MREFKRGDEVTVIKGHPYWKEIGIVQTVFSGGWDIQHGHIYKVVVMFKNLDYGTPVQSNELRLLTKLEKALK